jgi:GT2 family glycosyltransferase
MVNFPSREDREDLMPDKVSVIIPVFNKAAYSQRCFAAIVRSSFRPMEIIVVDNGSTDDTPAVLRSASEAATEAGIEFCTIRNDSNLGACTSRNQGLEAAAGQFIVVMDNDIVIRQRSWAEKMSAVLRDLPDVGIVGPKLLFAFPPHLVQCAGASVSPTGRVDFIGRGQPAGTPALNYARELQACISACWMMPRKIPDQLGGFDEIFNPVQFEDIDYSYRVRHAGYKILYLPTVEMYHFENVTTGMSPTLNSTYLIIKNGLTFKRRWQFMFSKENGPKDEQFRWAEIEKVPLDCIGELGLTD